MAWFRQPPSRDVEGVPLDDDLEPTDTLTYYWPRWRGSAKRIADLALILQERLGVSDGKPITVRWSEAFPHQYGPREFTERVEESRLSHAESIAIHVVGGQAAATVILSGKHGEPGAQLNVEGAERAALFDYLKGAVEMGKWRPMSAERLAVAAGYLAWIIVMARFTPELENTPDSVLSGVLHGLLFGVLSAVAVFAYVAATRFVLRALMPPLEIRSDGILALNALSTVARWAIAVVPAVFATVAGLSSWLG
jgi:hypothetical protein